MARPERGAGRGARQSPEAGENGGRRLRIVPIAVAAITVAAFGVGVWYAYDQGVNEGVRLKPPLIRAEPGPTKVVPGQPGGLNIPDQDKTVFDRITGETKALQVEQLLPPPELPMADAIPLPEPEAEEKVVTAPAAPTDTPAPKNPRPARESKTEPPPADKAAQPEKAPDRVISVPKTPAAKSKPAAKVEKKGGYRVQLAAFRTREQADIAWKKMKARHKGLLSGMVPSVMRADLGAGKGVFYRLRAGFLADRKSARALCDKLKARGQGCIVVQR